MSVRHPIHVLESNKAKMRMSDFPEEIPGQIAAGIKRLGTKGYTSYSIYPIADDVPYDEFPYPDEWIQTSGSGDRLTVEIRRRDDDGVYRVYTVGHGGTTDDQALSETIANGENEYAVAPTEVLSSGDAITLFQHYYDHHAVAPGWRVREQTEFTKHPPTPTAPTISSAATVRDGNTSGPVAASSESEVPSRADKDGSSDERPGSTT
jgi:hypothetical protein